MSQSPESSVEQSTPTRLKNYRDAWSALSHLIGQGKSFSGNERNTFFLNTQDDSRHRFAEAAGALGLDLNDDGRAIAITDWNGDGAPDIWMTNRTAPRVKLLLNSRPTNNWLRLKLTGTKSNRDAIGAKVTVKTSDPTLKTLTRSVRAGDGFLSQSSKSLHFGLGNAEVKSVTVRWPSGERQTFQSIGKNTRVNLREGDSTQSVEAERRIDVVDLAKDPALESLARSTTKTSMRTWLMGRVPLVEPRCQMKSDQTESTDQFIGKPLYW